MTPAPIQPQNEHQAGPDVWQPTHYVTADAVVVAIRDGVPHLLLIRRSSDSDAYPDTLALPGGHLDPGETLQECALRELREETGIAVDDEDAVYPVGTYSEPGRDPRGHYVTQAFLVLLRECSPPTAGDDAAAAEWVPLSDDAPGDLAFDHEIILEDAFEELCTLLANTCAALHLTPHNDVTITEIRAVYETMWPGFRTDSFFVRKWTELLRDTGRARPGQSEPIYNGSPFFEFRPPFDPSGQKWFVVPVEPTIYDGIF